MELDNEIPSHCSAFDKLSFAIFIECSYSKCLYLLFRSEGDKAYTVTLGSELLPVYCHMTDDLGACGGGGWTLVMKIDGNQVSSPLVACLLLLLRYFGFNYLKVRLRARVLNEQIVNEAQPS